MNFEENWYEFCPYLYMFLGFGVLIFLPGAVATLCGFALAIAGFSILRMRQAHRRQMIKASQERDG